jgi:hypothetical protein
MRGQDRHCSRPRFGLVYGGFLGIAPVGQLHCDHLTTGAGRNVAMCVKGSFVCEENQPVEENCVVPIFVLEILHVDGAAWGCECSANTEERSLAVV